MMAKVWIIYGFVCMGAGYCAAWLIHAPHYKPYRDAKGKFAKKVQQIRP